MLSACWYNLQPPLLESTGSIGGCCSSNCSDWIWFSSRSRSSSRWCLLCSSRNISYCSSDKMGCECWSCIFSSSSISSPICCKQKRACCQCGYPNQSWKSAWHETWLYSVHSTRMRRRFVCLLTAFSLNNRRIICVSRCWVREFIFLEKLRNM